MPTTLGTICDGLLPTLGHIAKELADLTAADIYVHQTAPRHHASSTAALQELYLCWLIIVGNDRRL